MPKHRIFRLTTVPQTLHKIIRGQLDFITDDFQIITASGRSDQNDTDYGQWPYKYYQVSLVRTINLFRDVQAIWKIYKILRTEKPTIIHTHTPKAGLVGMIAGWLARTPIRFHTVAGMPLTETNGLKKQILLLAERLTYALAHQVMPNSYGIQAIIKKFKLVNLSKVKILANGGSVGIDIEHFAITNEVRKQSNVLKAKHGIHEGMVFCFMGRLTKQKGVVELVDAFMDIFSVHEDAKLLILGRLEPHLDGLPEKYIDAIKDHPNIIYCGYQKDIRPYLALSHVFVFPSYREGLPNAVLQAGALGLPAIVTDIPGSNEIIIDGINGKIVPPKETNALKEAILSFISNKQDVPRMGEQARKMVDEKYNKKIVLQALKDEYDLWISRSTAK